MIANSVERDRDYKYLVSRLRQKELYLSKSLFIAVLNTINYIDEFGFSKKQAIKAFSTQNNVTQTEIKEVLDKIGYLTPTQSKRKYNTRGYSESKQLLNKLETE